MEADFSGYATKAGLKCSDGRTIMSDAFKHQDKAKVPLVWQHGHKDPENVLGHAVLESRTDGVYAYGFFNDTPKANHTRSLLEHGDINMLSIWANDLIERSGRVLHGAIREVSLVLSGANPGALIENVTIRHSEDDVDVLEDEAIIYTGLTFETSNVSKDDVKDNVEHATTQGSQNPQDNTPADTPTPGDSSDETIQDVYDTMTDKQKQVLHYMLGQALESAGSMQQDNIGDNEEKVDNADSDDKSNNNDDSKGKEMKHNVFEDTDTKNQPEKVVLSHSDIKEIVADATKTGSMKEAVESYCLQHGIRDIDLLFPDAQALAGTPDWMSRRMEWVGSLLSGVRKSPFSRIKTMGADITVAEARAKGYVKGNLKTEEFFRVMRRVTTPQTIYKKQKLDRDDIVDITDFDVVAWLKAEMRVMLDEELARAVIVGDGRLVNDPDKISEDNIRSVVNDHPLYTTTVTVNLGDANSSISEATDAIMLNRSNLRGSGLPTMFTTETYIAKWMMLKDTLGRRIYTSLAELASELRVSSIVAVEVLEESPTIIAVLFNPVDYVLGADRGGQVSMFDDFDIDYNQYKYLIESRCSGALIKMQSALVLKNTAAGTDVLVTPNAPTFVAATGVVTIVATTHVKYYNADTDVEMTTGAQTALDPGESVTVEARADTGYYISATDDYLWTFTHSA
jgi:Caudovirus prohead serine protease